MLRAILLAALLVVLPAALAPTATSVGVCTPPTGSVRTVAAACVEVAGSGACAQAETLAGGFARCAGLL
ncbi:MAG: hypothetical protein QOE90_1567 [Thermoplasmata archaeon]|jgi:hypothetical protein|nr:hypothetical protein [Thermoplasmata archaeon]